MNKVRVMFAVILLSLAGCASGEYKKAIVEYEKKSKEGYIKASDFLNHIDKSSFSYKINSGKIEELRKKVKEEYREKMRIELFQRYADTWIVYTKDDSLYISKFDGSEKRLLLGKDDLGEILYASWAPNGKYLGIIIRSKELKKNRLYIIDFETKEKSYSTMTISEAFKSNIVYDYYFSWSSNSERLICSNVNNNDGEIAAYVYDIKNKQDKLYFPKTKANKLLLLSLKNEKDKNVLSISIDKGISIYHSAFLNNSKDILFNCKDKLLLYESSNNKISVFTDGCLRTLDRPKDIVNFTNESQEIWNDFLPNAEAGSLLPIRLSNNEKYFITIYLTTDVCDIRKKRMWRLGISADITPSWSFDDEYIMSAGLEFDREYDPNTSLVIRSFQTDPVDENIEYFVTECDPGECSWSVPIKDLKLPEQKGDESLLKQFLK